ncbi:MAG: site-specific integrase [Alphaproteobacteria bacterium]|nr:site-specific integrase [Alphaproteobacteria bacterium]
MPRDSSAYRGMTLFTDVGERKYLNSAERQTFYDCLGILDDPKDRSFCEMIFWTGCRPSEALALTALNIDVAERVVVIRSLKKRGEMKGRHYRPVPVPDEFMERLAMLHGLRGEAARRDERLWSFSRTTGWARMKVVMEAAGLHGEKACAKGLRHGYGVHAAVNRVPETRIKKWLGHESLATTEIYLDMAAPEDRHMAERMWAA